jgi:two-component system, sensor histidine kinase LadS
MKRILFFIALWLLVVHTKSQDTIFIADIEKQLSTYDSVFLAPVYHFIDSTGKLKLADVLKKEFKIKIDSSEIISKCKTNSNWFRLKLKNCSKKYRQFYIDPLGYYATGYVLSVYDTTLHGNIEVRNGFVLPDSLRDFIVGAENPMNIFIDLGQTKTFFLNIRHDSVFRYKEGSRQSDEFIYPQDDFLIGPSVPETIMNFRHHLIQGIILGFLLLMFIYHLVMFVILRSKEYFYFSLYCFSTAFMYFYIKQLGLEIFGFIQIFLTPTVSVICIIAFLLLALYYGDVRKYYKKSGNFIIAGIFYSCIFLFAMISAILKIPVIGNISETIFLKNEKVPLIILALFVVYSLVPYIKMLHNKNKMAGYFIAANSIFIISIILWVVNIFCNLYELKYLGTMDIGFTGQMLVFAIGLVEKMNITNKEKIQSQQQLIEQLKVNTELQDKVNRELEQKVKERTIEIEEQKEEITSQRDMLFQQKKDITDSMEYAKFIQEALLTSHEVLDNCLLHNFILYKPRDIISGDFYWFKQIKNYLYFTAADCTGHGVPGAFMSVLGISLLNEIVGKRDLNPPALVLNELRKRLKKSLKQDNPNTTSQDGMDISLCLLDLETLQLQYAGAFNPLLVFRNNELTEYEADRMPVGVHPKDSNNFTNHEIPLQKGDSLYLFSDGYVSQFGGPEGKKLNMKQFKQLLLAAQAEPIENQNQILDTRLIEWQGSIGQVDDVLVIGVKV